MATGSVMLDSLDYRNAQRANYRDKIYAALADLQGVDPVRTYSKSKPAGFYGGMLMLYRPEQLGGLSVDKFLAALSAEGIDMSHRGYPLTHQLEIFAKGFDMFGKGTGPLSGDYPGYSKGSLPVTEEVHNRILGMPTFIEEEPGYSDQVIAAFQKVVSQYDSLL